MKGVIRTRVGYAGGSQPHPTYRSLGDHTETLQVDYDPKVISYDDLLEVFWQSHSPQQRPWSRQYASLILYGDEEQKQMALAGKARTEARLGQKVHTRIEPLEHFYNAEAYHQKYSLRRESRLARELLAIFPDQDDFMNSSAAAKVNGYLAGLGDPAQFERELPDLGLSSGAQEYLARIFKAHNRFTCN